MTAQEVQPLPSYSSNRELLGPEIRPDGAYQLSADRLIAQEEALKAAQDRAAQDIHNAHLGVG